MLPLYQAILFKMKLFSMEKNNENPIKMNLQQIVNETLVEEKKYKVLL